MKDKLSAPRFLPTAMLAAIASLTPVAANAEDAPTPFKLTIGTYRLSGGGLPSGPALDINLRHTSGLGNVWIGWFRSPAQEFTQTRVGWDRTFTAGPVRIMPSLQAATGGFLGGSLAFETGSSWFAGAGIGRTRLSAGLRF